MPDDARDLICLITHGTDHELSSIGLTIANGGITAGLKVSIFLSSSGVDLVRKRAADTTQVNPLEPLAKLIKDFMARGGTIWACTPCVEESRLWSGGPPRRRCYQRRERGPRRIKTGAATRSAFRAVPAQFEPSLSWRCRSAKPRLRRRDQRRRLRLVIRLRRALSPDRTGPGGIADRPAPRHADGTGEPRCRARRH